MKINNCEINILIKGRRVTEFKSPMDFQTYIEGRDGSEFEVEFVNNNHFDVEAILSIDGLSIIDGKPAGSQSSGYVVSARSRTVIPGWKVDGETAAHFQFSGAKGGSYVEQRGGDAQNKGVIGAKVYARKQSRVSFASPINVMRGKGGLEPFGNGYAGGPYYTSNCVGGTFASSSVMPTSATLSASASTTDWAHTSDWSPTSDSEMSVEQTLGTEFGKATDFETKEVSFERGDIVGVMVLYYDDRQGLKRRGIDVTQSTIRPSAFPADEKGCTPPAGWTK